MVRNLPTRDGILSIMNNFNSVFFVWATFFIDTALVTVITGGWLILFVVYQKRYDKRARYSALRLQDWLLMGAAMAGVALVTLSQAGSLNTSGGWRFIWGLSLAALSTVCASWVSHRFKLGAELYESQLRDGIPEVDGGKIEISCTLAVSIVANVVGILFSLLIGLLYFPGETGSGVYLNGFISSAVVSIIAIGGVSGLSAIAFRYANLETKNLGVNAMQYLRPVLSLVWLGLFATVDLYRTDFLWIGATAVIAVNALINFRSEERAGFKWLILSLLGFGFIVYMRDEWFAHIPGYGWFPTFGDYYGLLAAGVTAFVLILSFRTSRLNARSANEEQQTHILCQELLQLATSNSHRVTILKNIRTIDTAKDITRLKKAYECLSQEIGTAGLEGSERARLQANLNTLVDSKQRGRNIAELIVLVMLAFVVSGLAVFARTEAATWPALLNDMFSMLLASVVTFMTIHLFDQRSERDDPIITETGSVLFRDHVPTGEQNPKVERAISIGIGFAVIGIYAYLMVLKWLPV